MTDRRDLQETETTVSLLVRIRGGDSAARNLLLQRYHVLLRRWASGRLPSWARDVADTDDLVQVTMIGVLGRLNDFHPRHEGAFLAYLRQALLNRVRDEIRKAQRRPVRGALDEDIRDASPGPLDHLLGAEAMGRYERGLARLSAAHREAIILRFEFGYSFDQVAAALGRPNAHAARQLVLRAIVNLVKAVHDPE